ncbi:MAG: hypothetical protein ABJK37_22240 [Paraglaciecola sp.]|uniref:hypothetical protein n=1 Tax=Paraglaciecola sp. TaxID=1920173 RepID=UPI00329794A5
MSFTYCFTFSSVEMSVRYGDNASNDDVIGCYVHLGLERAKQLEDIVAVRNAYMRVLNTLIDTMCDHCLASVWRKQCYRYIKRLLPLLYEILDQHQYLQKISEIQILYSYCFEQTPASKQSNKMEVSALPIVKKQP